MTTQGITRINSQVSLIVYLVEYFAARLYFLPANLVIRLYAHASFLLSVAGMRNLFFFVYFYTEIQ